MIPNPAARRYVAWLGRHTRAIVLGHLLAFAVAGWLIVFHLPLLADLTDLLPDDAPGVVDLAKLASRVDANDTVLVVIEGPDPGAIADEFGASIRALSADRVVRVDGDRRDARAFLWAHRFLLAPLAELQRARDSLRRRISTSVLATNPLFIDLEDDGTEASRAEAARVAKQEVADLRARRDKAERTLHSPSNVSVDGRFALLEVRTPIAATDVDRGRGLLDALDAARARTISGHPGVTIGFAGDLVTSVAEHDSIAAGTLVSSAITVALVSLVLALYFRSLRVLGLLVGVLVAATVVAFGIAALTVGHLNAATAFLGAVIAGNGVNYGILLIARFLEERSAREVEAALAEAIAATVRPTAVASLGAMVAYGSLAATSFRGFSDFAIIGAVGMLVCWVATYGLLPVMLLCHAREARAVVDERWIGRLIVRIFGIRRRGIALAVAGIVLLGSGVIVARYLVGDPFEYDMRELGSVGATSEAERHWMATADAKFGRGRAGRTIIAVDRDDQVASVVGALAAPERAASVGSVESILSVVPEVQDQHAKLVVLSEIRKLIDDPALDALEEAEHAEILALRPPDDVAMITRGMLPPSLLALVTDRMGVVGRMISVRPADGMDELDGHAMMRFAAAVRRIELPDHSTVTTSGASVIFADILETIARDGPLVTAIAVAGIVLVVLAVVGRDRLAVAVLAATACGTLAMVAICALLGARVTFLDFVALPITLGLGVDYAINVAHRREVVRDSIAVLRTTGVAVLVCSVTTMIGYASLLASDNLTIRGFGRASLIGEITTVVSALFLVPAVLGAGRR